MFDLGVLDTIISIVVVLLVLSLIVQSIQSLLKKLLKMKSSIVFGSMTDLFRYIDTEKLIGIKPQQLVEDVTAQFKALGRVSLILRRPMLDSISKADLQKILNRLHGDKLKADVENWFDTVMQGFEERYTRHMKTVALIISFATVIVLNANFFNIYRNIAASDIQRSLILQKGEALLEQLKQQQANAAISQTQKPTSTPTPTAPKTAKRGSPASPAATATPKPADSPVDAEPEKTKEKIAEDFRQNTQQAQQYANDYKGLGFTPLRWRQVGDYLKGEGYWARVNPATGQKPTGAEWFIHGLQVLLGWTIMALLLSVGAPFWQDALESLFGLKGWIRKKSQTQNVEEGSGQGQTKP